MSEVKILRLTSGEELIGKVEQVDDVSYIIKKAAIILPVGEGRVGLAPYLPYCDVEDGIEILSRFVMFVVDPVTEFKNQYNSVLGSGVVVPDSAMVGASPVGSGDIPSLKLTE